jgi:ribosome biogenesis GTPase / thiamine phosphate phosphatase
VTTSTAGDSGPVSSTGVVVATMRRRYDVERADGSVVPCVLRGRSLLLAVGDHVTIEQDAGGAAIVAMSPRRNLIYRSDAFKAKLLAADVTQIAGVVAPDVALDTELIHRWMIAAEAAQCRFVVLANKSDLPAFGLLQSRLAGVAALGYPIVGFSARDDVSPVLSWLRDQHTVLVGQSGMGKSTLVNALLPLVSARTAEVSTALNTGKHTTTSTSLYRLPALGADAWIVDSPGMKAFALAHLDPQTLADAFVEIRPLLGHCRFRDCRHGAEPGCAITAAVADGRIVPHRLALMQRLIAEAGGFARR